MEKEDLISPDAALADGTNQENPIAEISATEASEQGIEAPAASAVSNKQKLMELLKGVLGDGYNADDDESSSGKLYDYISKGREKDGKLAEALTKDPRLAQLLSDVVGGKRNAHAALARYFGKDFLSAEEGTPEYDDLMQAEEERRSEAENAERGAKEYSENLDVSMPIVEEFCKGKGYEVEEFLDNVWGRIVSPIMCGKYSEELCGILDNGMNYSSDIADAMKAGEVKGRNLNIARMRKDDGDGLPKNVGNSGNPAPEKRKKASTILDMAKDA